jgi:hypothetical protein
LRPWTYLQFLGLHYMCMLLCTYITRSLYFTHNHMNRFLNMNALRMICTLALDTKYTLYYTL